MENKLSYLAEIFSNFEKQDLEGALDTVTIKIKDVSILNSLDGFKEIPFDKIGLKLNQ